MGTCQSASKEKPFKLVETKDARDVVDQYNKYQSSGIQKDKLEFRFVYAFRFKNELFEVVRVYQEPVKIPDIRYQSDIKDDWEKVLIKRVNLSDYQAQIEENNANPREIQSKSVDETEYLLMMNLINQNTSLVHEKQIRFFEKLKHPNLVEYMDRQKINNQLTAFKEYCPQGSIIKYLERNKKELNADIIFDLIEDVCNALRYLYDRAIVDFELSLEMMYVSNNMIKIDLYNGVYIDEYAIRHLQQEGHKNISSQLNSMIINSRVQLPSNRSKQVSQGSLKPSQKSRVVLDDQAQVVEEVQKKYKVDENKIDIEFVRRFCLFILFDQDFRVMLKQKQAVPESKQILDDDEDEIESFKEIDVGEIKEVRKAPKDLKEFIEWTLNKYKSLRPNIRELHNEIQRIRLQPNVIAYINQLYTKNSKNVNSNQQVLFGDEKLKEYQSHYFQTTLNDEDDRIGDKELRNQDQYESSKNALQVLQNRHLVLNNAPISQEEHEESVQNQQNNTIQNSLNIDNINGSFHLINNQDTNKIQRDIKIWEEVEELPSDQNKEIVNQNELINVQFQFYEETYKVVSYINKSEYGLGFRVENVNKNQPRNLCLKISKSKSYNLFLQKEFNVLKQFGTLYIINSYSQVNVKGLSGIVVDLYNQNLQQYLINSGKLDIASQLIDFLHQFLSGLHQLHVKDIVHRQLSFDSICILSNISNNQSKLIAKLFNLELAIQIKQEAYIGSEIPINFYSSPEMREKLSYNIQSDVYSAGIIILSALCNVSAKKIQSIVYPDLIPQSGSNQYISHVVDQNANLHQSHYQKVYDQIQNKKPKEEEKLNEKSQIKDMRQSNIIKSNPITQENSSQNKTQSKNETQVLQQTTNNKRLSSSRQDLNVITLREVLGEKCPQIIIDTFEKMISKQPLLRGSCSDYLNEILKLKSNTEVINYINMQNKQTRLI